MQLTQYLEEKKIKYELHAHRPTFSAQKMAAAEHVPGHQVAKPVIVQADGRYYMCVLPACCNVDLDALRTQLDAGEVQLAGEKELGPLFPDCELGAEPPIGTLFGLPTLMDQTLTGDDFLILQTGRHDQAVKLHRADYEKLAHPRVLRFSYHLQ